ncbi:MAG: hypothetical protein LBJ63_08445 [Prevotellaceae bacterium]|nr:hypothetical protein [Prevotellaceae bacterium]
MNFCSEIESFISANYDGNTYTDSIINDMYGHILIPDKNIAVMPVTLPVCSLDKSQKLFFQNLSIAAARQNLQLIIIHEDRWITKRNIICRRILSHLGKFVRIHGRQCEVKRIAKVQADEFLQQNHLYGSPQAKHKYGLFYKHQLVAAASFSGGRPIVRGEKVYRSYELVRFANYQNCIVYGGVGKLISHFIAEHNPDDIMSYADVDWSPGKSYEKLGFKFIEYTEPQKFYLDVKTCQRHYPKRLPQELLCEFSRQSLPLDDFLSQHDIFTVYNSGNKKYLLKLK